MTQDGFFAALKGASLEADSRQFLELESDTTTLEVGFSPAPAILPIWLRRDLDNQGKLRLAHVSAGDPGALEAWLSVTKLNWFRIDDKGVVFAWESHDFALEGDVIADLRLVDRFLKRTKDAEVEVRAPGLDLDDGKKPDFAGAGEAMRRISAQASQAAGKSPQESDAPSSAEVQAGLREVVFVTQGAVPKTVKAFVLNDMGDILNVHVPPGQPLPSREYSIKKSSLI